MCNLLLTSGDQSMGRITCGVMSRRGELNSGRRIPSSESGKATPTENDVHFYNSTSSVFEAFLIISKLLATFRCISIYTVYKLSW